MNSMLMLQFIRKVPKKNSVYKFILKVSLDPPAHYAGIGIRCRERRSLREASRSRLALSRFPFTCYSGYGKRRKVLYVTKRKLIDGPFCVSDRKKIEKIRKNLKKFEKVFRV